MFYYSSAQGYQSRLQHTSQDVRELLSKSFDSFISFTTDLKNQEILLGLESILMKWILL